jgi:hypothetical protein
MFLFYVTEDKYIFGVDVMPISNNISCTGVDKTSIANMTKDETFCSDEIQPFE